jgi:hypothetical protein
MNGRGAVLSPVLAATERAEQRMNHIAAYAAVAAALAVGRGAVGERGRRVPVHEPPPPTPRLRAW